MLMSLNRCFSKMVSYIFAVLGSDLKNGICGKGETPEDALMDWNDQFREVLRGPDLDNPAIRYVLETISALKREI